MLFRTFLLSALPLFSLVPSTAALLGINLDLLGLTKLDLDVGLLKNGALVNVDAFGNILGSGDCPSANVGVQASVLSLVKTCVCINLLHNGLLGRQTACPACPANSAPICGGAKCGCACAAGFYSDQASKTCLPKQSCISTGGALLNYDNGTSQCTCTSPLQSTGMGSCSLPPSARARRHRRDFSSPKHHGRRNQRVFPPATSEALTKTALVQDVDSSEHCPQGETACPLSSGGVECIDTTASLTSCGGCVGDSLSGTNCLSIPGALHVECQSGSCAVASCFKGWSFSNGRCI